MRERDLVRRLLAWAVVLSLVLPMLIAVLSGLGALLVAGGDVAGAAACSRVALVCSVGWFLSLVGAVIACGIITLDRGPAASEGSATPPVEH